ncbi:D-alanyl-D-alanine carboxypeptidase/D-alanyl-D-alanine-endopeptidase [Brevibacillus sp. 179-C9.3 HS]|uniref:D-alanyl-D-alanine carboxypeptidase/D-alanyl-D-alanine endopeptidase n=1 Tax=unclassified Brevibacillus TaxID=2684853 RepID=UPI0039A2E35F
MNHLFVYRRVCTWFFVLALLFQVAASPALAREESAPSGTLALSIEKYLADLKNDENSKGMYAGIAIYDLTDNKYLYKHNAARNFIPASNMKLFTTMAGLDKLGPDYQWKTDVFASGKVQPSGVLQGDLILKGYGDPSLTPADLQTMAKAIKDLGIKQIKGNLLLDESYFDETRLGTSWMWDDEPYGYSAQVSGLAVNKNFTTLTATPGKTVNEAPVLTMNPATTYITVTNKLITTEGKESNVLVERPRGKNEIIVSGTIGVNAAPYDEDVTMEDPAFYVGDLWKEELLKQGIKLNPQVELKKTVLQSGVPLYTHLSKPLSEITIELNKDSDNFYAEMLLKTLGVTQKGEGSFEAGSEAVADVMKRADIDTGFRQVDGSGLSRFNMITPEQMIETLIFLQEQEYRTELEESLPIAGVDGTLKNRMKGTSAEKNLAAKTGSLSGVNTMSGYVTAKNGHKLAFSILINGIYKSKYARELQDRIGILLTTYPDIVAPEGFNPPPEKSYELSALIDPILDTPEAAGVTASIMIKSLDTAGEPILYERDADTLLTPASNLKLLTTATALNQLGSDYVFKTEVYGDAPITPSGVQQGNLYVKGFGDPTLHTENALQVQEGVSIEKIAGWIKQQGIKQIKGNLVMDESYFDQQRLGLGWAWDDESYYYNPTIGALALNRGTVMVEYKPAGSAGEAVQMNLLPKTSYVQVINEAKTVQKGEDNTFSILRDRGTNTIRLTGNLPLDHEGDYERVPVEEPAKYVGTVLREALEQQGITFAPKSEVVIQPVPTTAVKWTQFQSLPLKDIVQYLNKRSDNYYAEMLLKTLGAAKKGSGTAAAGAEVVQETVASLGGNITFDMMDGSGLTRYNLISARQIVAVLEGMTKQSTFGAFNESLPVAGMDGTLKNRLKETPAANNLHAKTGSMTGVNTLSGYMTTKGKEKLIVSIMFNGYVEDEELFTKMQDQIITILASYE